MADVLLSKKEPSVKQVSASQFVVVGESSKVLKIRVGDKLYTVGSLTEG